MMDVAIADKDKKLQQFTGAKKIRKREDQLQPIMDKTNEGMFLRKKTKNIDKIISALEDMPAGTIRKSHYAYKPVFYDSKITGPQNIIGHIAYILGYPSREIKGNSLYGYIQEHTGWDLETLHEIGTLCWPQKVISYLKGEDLE